MNRARGWSIGRPAGRSIVSNIFVAVALAAIFGTGTAAAALVVRSSNIVDGEVKTADLANGAVTTNKIAANAVTGAKVDESSLGIVPNADTLDGRDSTAFVAGPGRVISGWNSYSHGDGVYIFLGQVGYEVGFNISTRCSDDTFYLTSYASVPWDVWYRHNGDQPVYKQLAAGATYITDEADVPHLITIHLFQPATGRQAMLEYAVYESAPTAEDPWGHCYPRGEAVLNY